MLPFLFSFFNDFLFYYTFYVSYFLANSISPEKLVVLFIIMSVSKMIADIPMGIISDKISRRNILAFGILCRCIFCILCIVSKNYTTFALSMFIVGISNSCLWTHTWNYFYDYLKEKGKQCNFPNFMGKYYAISNIAICLAGFIGSYVYKKIGFYGIFVASIQMLIVAFLILLKLPNYKPKTDQKTAKNLGVANPLHLFKLIRVLLKKPKIIRLLILTILMDSMFVIFLDMNTTLMNSVKFNPETISQIVAFVSFIRIFTNYFSGKTEKFMSFKLMHTALFVLSSVGLILSLKNAFYTIIAVSTYLCIYPFFDTSIKTKIQHKVDSNTRATIMSSANLFVSILIIVFNSLITLITKEYNYVVAPVCIFLIVILILFVIRNITLFYRADKNIRKIIYYSKNCIKNKILSKNKTH